MRKAIVGLAVLACGCSEGAVGPQGPQGERGPEGPPGGTAEVASLRAELAAVKAELAMVAAARVKVPHLVAEDGSDLGRYLDADTVIVEGVGVVAWGRRPLVYDGANCTGRALAPGGPEKRGVVDHFVDDDGKVYGVRKLAAPTAYSSSLLFGVCQPTSGTTEWEAVDASAVLRATGAVRVELR